MTVSTLAETTLSNTNNIIHPPIMLANAAITEAGEHYLFYREGLSTGAGHMIDAVDEERLALLRALGHDAVPLTHWFARYYDTRADPTISAADMLRNRESLATSAGPTTLQHRYILDDVVYGLAPMEELALRVDVPTPFISALITVLSTLTRTDLRQAASALVDRSSLVRPATGAH